MKIGIISDTHGSLAAWQAAVRFFADADIIIHAGDVLYHGARNPLPDGYDPKQLAQTLNQLAVPLLVAQGNCDSEVDQMVLDWPVQAPYLFTQVEGFRILTQHGHNLSPEQLVDTGRRYKADLVVTGHTHVPELEKHEGIILVNPGSPAIPKQPDKLPTAAVLAGDSLRIIRVDNGETITSLSVGKADAKHGR